MDLKIILIIFITFIVGISSQLRLRVDIHIESRCRFSAAFILQQLKPTYSSIRDFVDLNFYVLGKSESFLSIDENIEFFCQHGERECFLNIYQTCALFLLGNDTDRKVEFVVCAMNPENEYSKCVNLVQLNQMDVDSCLHGPQGLSLQLKVEQISAPIIAKSFRVPTIVYNQEFNYTVSQFSQVDFNWTFWQKFNSFQLQSLNIEDWKEKVFNDPINIKWRKNYH